VLRVSRRRGRYCRDRGHRGSRDELCSSCVQNSVYSHNCAACAERSEVREVHSCCASVLSTGPICPQLTQQAVIHHPSCHQRVCNYPTGNSFSHPPTPPITTPHSLHTIYSRLAPRSITARLELVIAVDQWKRTRDQHVSYPLVYLCRDRAKP
jgi:hypothetical protein